MQQVLSFKTNKEMAARMAYRSASFLQIFVFSDYHGIHHLELQCEAAVSQSIGAADGYS